MFKLDVKKCETVAKTDKKIKYEKPELTKYTIVKTDKKIFNGCWQVANQQDAC